MSSLLFAPNSIFNTSFFLTEKELITPPLNGLILPGITRDSILSLARQWGRFKVNEASFTMPQVCQLIKEERVSFAAYLFIETKINIIIFAQLLELFGTGTACVVSPIERIHYLGEDILIPTMEQSKPVFDDVKKALTDIQYGKVDHPWAMIID